MAEHPIMSVYGRNTLQADFPLILVVGREPNDDLPMGDAVGYHEFKQAVPFWDLTYTLVAESIGRKGMELKGICKVLQSSPIAFTDISSKPVLSGDKRKQRTRETLTSHDYVEHLQSVASKPVFERVQLVIFSGLTYPEWARAKYGEALEQIESEWKKEYVEVPFFYGQNMRAIKADFSKKSAVAKRIVGAWVTSWLRPPKAGQPQ